MVSGGDMFLRARSPFFSICYIDHDTHIGGYVGMGGGERKKWEEGGLYRDWMQEVRNCEKSAKKKE